MVKIMDKKKWVKVLDYQIDYYLITLFDAIKNNDKETANDCKRHLRTLSKSKNNLVSTLK